MQFLLDSPAYSWLPLSNQACAKLEDGTALRTVRKMMIEYLEACNKGSLGSVETKFDVAFELVCPAASRNTWELDSYNSCYIPRETYHLQHITTITGAVAGTQALSASDYMRMVWPFTGPEILQVLRDLHFKWEDYNDRIFCSRLQNLTDSSRVDL